MRKIMSLLESVIDAYLWTSTFTEKHGNYLASYVAKFVTDDNRVGRVMFYFNNDADEAELIFNIDGSEEITGGGDAFRIFATVIDVTRAFVKDHPEMRYILFRAEDPSRNKVYSALAKRLSHNVTFYEREGVTYFRAEV